MSKTNQGDLIQNHRVAPALALALALWVDGPDAFSQLAITEVMSNGSTAGLDYGFQRPDFWELTNFGTNGVDLTGYRWWDGDEKSIDAGIVIPAGTIWPGESVLFVRNSGTVPDPAAFRAWWGSNRLANVQIYYPDPQSAPGFDAENGDAVRLWDAEGRLVDEVRFGSGILGVTFTYEPHSGAFSESSRLDFDGAFYSAQGTDIGSPGIAPRGPVPIQITQEPVSQDVDAGSGVVLRVQATGRPAPRYQWYTNGVPIPSVVITSAVPRLVYYAGCGPSWERPPGPNDLAIAEIQPHQGGNYFVEVFNGLNTWTSSNVTVTVKTNPVPIQVECPPEASCAPTIAPDGIGTLVANPGQTAIFTVQTRGYPVPTFQWSSSSNGITFTDLPGATNRQLTLTDIASSHAGYYRVQLQNSSGTVPPAVGRLSIQSRAQLRITEVMSLACVARNRDWWELTNTGDEPVNLCGYRWDDTIDDFTIGGGPTITNSVMMQPGESIILLESQTAESFVQWWGATNLPPNLQFVTYAANNLGEETDAIRVWPPNETDRNQWLASVEFSAALPGGVTRWWDLSRCTNEWGTASTNGQCGAFRAEKGCVTEMGSPGWTRWTPPVLTSVVRQGSHCTLSWKAQPGSANQLQFARRLEVPPKATVWEDLGTHQFLQASCVFIDSSIGSEAQRFYRVLRVAVADCPCPDLEQ